VEIQQITPVSENREHGDSVDAISANPVNRAQYASGSHDHTIRLWDAESHRCLKTMRGHNDGVWSLKYMKDGRSLISASVDGSVKIWDANQGGVTTSLNFHESKVYSAAANDAMNMAVSVGADRKIAVWDLRKVQTPLFVNEDSTASVTCCDFTNDQKSIVTATFGGRVNVIDLDTREYRVDYDIMFLSENEEENMCYHVASVSDYPGGGNVFVLSSGIGIPNVINYEGWHEEPLHRLETVGKFHGHTAAVRYCDFSPDRSKMLSACADHSLRVWSRESQATLNILSGHSDLATCGAWLNERTIVSGSWDCKIMVWNI